MTVIFIECALHGSQLLQALQSFLVFESFLVAASDLPTSRGKQKKNPNISVEDMSVVQATATHHKLWVCKILA